MVVRVIKEHNGIPEGSGVHVERELKNEYIGVWSNMFGSFEVKIKKKFCEIKSL